MPTYSYRCSDCQFEFEEFHSITKTVDECPRCKEQGRKNSRSPEKLITNGSFILLGGCWSKDNYK